MWSRFFVKIENFKENIRSDIVFFVFGFLLPYMVLVFRVLCNLAEIHFTFYKLVIFCYLPTFIIFFIARKYNSSFFIRKLESFQIVLTLYSTIARLHCYFYEKKMRGFCFLFFYLTAYLLVSYNQSLFEIPFLIFRQFFVSYCAFLYFFEKESKNLESEYFNSFHKFRFFNNFLKSYISLKSEENQINKNLFCGVSSLVFFCLYRENKRVQYCIKLYEKSAENSLFILQSKLEMEELTLLCLEKKNIFFLPKRVPIFYFISHQICTNILQKCEDFVQKLENLT